MIAHEDKFQVPLFIGENRAGIDLASCSRRCRHADYWWENRFNLGASADYPFILSHIAAVGYPQPESFCRIQRASAAKTKDAIATVFFVELACPLNQLNGRIRLNLREHDRGYTACSQNLAHLFRPAAFEHKWIGDQKYLRYFELPYPLPHITGHSGAQHHIRHRRNTHLPGLFLFFK